MRFNSFYLIAILFAFLTGACAQPSEERVIPKNVILFIGDGMGYNHVDATSIFFHGETGQLIFEGPEWTKVAQATYPAIVKTDPENLYATGYNPRAAWTDPSYLKKDYTDSGAAGTALSTGVKTYDGAIGLGPTGDTLMHIYQHAKNIGKSAGVITSVQISHATPAAFSAHNQHRRNYEQIAQYQILQSRLDVLMGAGHPEFDNNAQVRTPDYRFVGGEELWTQLNQGQHTNFTIDGIDYTPADVTGNGMPDAWTLVTDSTAFAEIAAGNNVPKRLLGIPTVQSTLQYSREGEDEAQPFTQPFNPGLPNLEQMTRAAVNVLSQNPQGFFLMVEGGAIDWAGHGNHTGRLIEEMHDFVNSVAAVVEWVETYSSWDETLVIVSSDHETGMLWGPKEQDNVLTRVKNKGKGLLPGVEWHYTSHTNALVPVYARGAGNELLEFFADEHDPVKGPFMQNTEIPKSVFILWNGW